MFVDKEFPAFCNNTLCKDQELFSQKGFDKITWKRAIDMKTVSED